MTIRCGEREGKAEAGALALVVGEGRGGGWGLTECEYRLCLTPPPGIIQGQVTAAESVWGGGVSGRPSPTGHLTHAELTGI